MTECTDELHGLAGFHIVVRCAHFEDRMVEHLRSRDGKDVMCHWFGVESCAWSLAEQVYSPTNEDWYRMTSAMLQEAADDPA